MSADTRQSSGNFAPRESVTGTFSRLAPWTLGTRLVVMVMAIVATAVLTRTMTRVEWSEYSLLKTMWWYMWLLGQLGLSEATLRFGAELSAQGDTRGFRRLLVKMLLIQALAVAAMMVLFLLMRGWLDTLFCMRFGFALIMTVILGGITIFKETLRQGYVAAYWVKLVALMSVVGAVTFPVASYVYISVLGWGVEGGLAAEATGYGLMMLVFALGLPRLKFKRTAPAAADEEPVTNYRVFRYAGAIVSNHAITLMVGQETVIFLIGYFLRSQEGAVGIYNLAYLVPRQGLSFLALAIIPLVTAMLIKTYYQDKTRLPELLSSYYKLMIMMIVPLVAVGVLFVDKALIVLAGARGVEAGRLATILLPVNLVMILVIPITTGMNVLEKAQRLIIPRLILGTAGIGMTVLALFWWPNLDAAAAARYLRILTLTPILIYLSARLVGGLYFPYRFFGRAVLTCLPVALLYPLRSLWPYAKLIPMMLLSLLRPVWPYAEQLGYDLAARPAIGGLIFLIGVAVVSVLMLAESARLVGLFGSEEVKYFQNAKLPGMNTLMKFLVPKKLLPKGV